MELGDFDLSGGAETDFGEGFEGAEGGFDLVGFCEDGFLAFCAREEEGF